MKDRCPFCNSKLKRDKKTILGVVYACTNPKCNYNYHLVVGSRKKILELFKEKRNEKHK